MSFKFTVFVQKEDDWYVAKCLENNIASQGKTIEEALANLKEAVELFYEDEKPSDEFPQTFITTMDIKL
ncbi:putative RNase H-like HicB family nuclease [Natranaerovirga pectinivora]|uniref:Putative RNase H-like HicB family nuclease n=1 Tax=Natranaerovirga pectinivora TaxID=682400 RepID=A0A4R3MLR0_9FIRM|nr:type II toxin-antitoxin system HicB family antitoxin [Natranaerovirga pectinivora]TCT15636.1 putative RNase H-like HicB family nuclease [Natranaerovirga pectinivora]